MLVSNALTMTAGNINTGSNILTIGTGTGAVGSLTHTAGILIGKLERWIALAGSNITFPVGSASNLNTFIFRGNSGLTGGKLQLEFIAFDPGDAGLPLNESSLDVVSAFADGYWNVTALNGFACTNYNVTLRGTGFADNYINTDTRVIKRTNGGNWTFDGTHAVAANPLVYRNALNGVSGLGTQFALGAIDCIGGAVIDNQTICSGDDVPAFTNVTDARGGANVFTYTWQYTTNGAAVAGDGNWTDIPLTNANGYNHGTLATGTRFIRKSESLGCNGAKYSNIITVTVNPRPDTGPIYRTPNK